MERDQIEARVKAMLVEHLGVPIEEVQDETLLMPPAEGNAPNLGADSLDIVELVMAAEEEFGLQIDDDAVANKLNGASVRGMIDYLAAELAERV